MSDLFEEIRELVEERLQQHYNQEVKKIVEDWLENRFSRNGLFNGPAAKVIRQYASEYTSTEIGNRLRNGNSGALCKRVFNEHFEKNFKKQIEVEIGLQIKNQVQEAIQAKIAEVLK